MSDAADSSTRPTVVIDPRFCGPPTSGNGGYCCGVAAAQLVPGDIPAATVTLRAPPPLGVALDVRPTEDGVSLWHGDVQIADAVPATLDLDLPAAPGFGSAAEAAAAFRGFEQHIFPGCFVCGPAREPDDGLCIFAGPLASDPDTVAATWVPDANLVDAGGKVAAPYLWAALDCPGYFALAQPDLKALLGCMTAAILRRPEDGARCIVLGWRIASDGRKHDVGTAIVDEQGAPYAIARARWIALRSP